MLCLLDKPNSQWSTYGKSKCDFTLDYVTAGTHSDRMVNSVQSLVIAHVATCEDCGWKNGSERASEVCKGESEGGLHPSGPLIIIRNSQMDTILYNAAHIDKNKIKA